MSQTTEKRSRFARFGALGRRVGSGVRWRLPAFWLNNYQQHQQDAERRDRILASIEQQLRKASRAEKLTARNRNDEPRSFGVRSTPVRCRRCSPFVFITDYSPGDFATMLQSGGVQLLDVETLTALRERRIGYPLGTERHGALSEIK